MSFAKLGDTVGFDEQRDLLVLSLRQTTNLYLPKFTDQPVTVRSADPAVATVASTTDLTDAQKKSALPSSPDSRFGGVGPSAVLNWFGMNKIVVRGESVGETQLIAELPGQNPWQSPTKVVVVGNLASRQVDRGACTASLQQDLQTMSLRDAAVRIAQDQVNSSFTKDGKGDARYDLPTGLPSTDWCGAFLYWCYQRASAIKGVGNPLGPINDVVLSPQKAIGWALVNPLTATVLRYKGLALFQWGAKRPLAKQDQLIDAVPGTNLLPGDICLLRNDGNWQHVCLVCDPGDGDMFLTLDGNQGSPSMKMVKRDWNARLGNGTYAHVFVHLNLP
jgi:hypothetical protein